MGESVAERPEIWSFPGYPHRLYELWNDYCVAKEAVESLLVDVLSRP